MSVVSEYFSAVAEFDASHATPETVTGYCKAMVRTMSEQDAPSAPQKEKFHRLARATGLTEGQAKRLFYGEWSAIPAHVFLAVQSAYRHHLDRARRRAEHQAALYRDLSERWDNECAGSSFSTQANCSGLPASSYAPRSR
ncbi:hypothetical protein [Asaia krungthepensis]|uniref:Uncharacterized protein n=1 Tax=Asaia krungthepensis NRIC 0535 TaxID=1307925 RepID=A0ABQ0Q342_9PROT|nr:hypothetical protein [Asaia krungthepensis]GBQ89064.1 hypothetical protein AA0535_1702 [Asaia krungthepensis NRIC 0535]